MADLVVQRLLRMIQFVEWMQSRRRMPTAEEVADFLNCSRPTAYRWRRAWLDHVGTEP